MVALCYSSGWLSKISSTCSNSWSDSAATDSAAARFSCNCDRRVAPVMTELMSLRRRIQAIASWAVDHSGWNPLSCAWSIVVSGSFQPGRQHPSDLQNRVIAEEICDSSSGSDPCQPDLLMRKSPTCVPGAGVPTYAMTFPRESTNPTR
jgi:hypothetical protein